MLFCMKYVLFIIGILIQICSFSQSPTKMIARAAALYTIYNNTMLQPNLETRQPDFTQIYMYKPNINFTSKINPIANLPKTSIPKLIMPKEGAPNFRLPDIEAAKLLLLQDTAVRNIIQKIQSENSYSKRYLSETNSLEDYDKLVSEIYPIQTEEITSRTNKNEFHFFEMKETTRNQFMMNRYKSYDSKKNRVSGLYNLYSISAGGVEPIAEPQFGYSKMALTTTM
jgi:hypothetical protein